MPATVYFATNRVLNGAADQLQSYGESVVAPSNPNFVTYGTAYVEDANLTADTIGAIKSIQDIEQGRFSQNAVDDLSDPGRICSSSSMASTTASRMPSHAPPSTSNGSPRPAWRAPRRP